MHRSLVTLTLAGPLALATLCEAGPRVRQPPPLLTPEETLCYAFGELTYDIAIGRDSGLPVLETLSIMRNALRTTPDVAPTLNAMVTGVAQDIYTYRLVRPEAVRETYTLVCLKERPFASVPRTRTKTKDRY